MENITRREFLKISGSAAAALMIGTRGALALEYLAPVKDALGAYPYRGWETLYRDLYTWDYVSRSTHSMNCTGSCTWKVYVKNEIAFKEEQYADYPEQDLPTCPSYNPRGCQKGANYIEYIYGPQRLKYPLIRTGARGEGKWKKASWGQVRELIATNIVNAIKSNKVGPNTYVPDAVTFYSAIPAKHQITFAGGARLSNLIGGVMCSFYDWYCDLPPGEPQTWGEQTDSCEAADWYNSNYIILWGANLLETRIPDAHFATEARARGAKIVAIFPEYNPVSIHADLYVPIKPGTDSALAMAMANVIVNNNLYDGPYLKSYTDMPFLVKADGKFLRESDMVAGGSQDKLYIWDANTNTAVLAPGTMGYPKTDPKWTLDLGAINPALELPAGTSVATVAGNAVVETVFTRLKLKLADYDPASVSATTGVNAAIITQMATEFAAAKPAMIIEGAGVNHYFHNDLNNRTEILLVALTGNVGKPGGGFNHYVGQEKIWPEAGWFKLSYPNSGTITATSPDAIQPAPVELKRAQRFQNTTLWTFMHANVTSDVDNILNRPLGDYITDSVNNGWMPLYPKGTLNNGKAPKVLFIWGANYINQAKGWEPLRNTLLPKLDTIVSINVRMDTSALYADIVLPAASHYEKWDLNSSDLHAFMHPFTPVIQPLWESKTDWKIWQELAKGLQGTGFSYTDNFHGINIKRDFNKIVKDFETKNTSDPNYYPNGRNIAADRDACQFILDNALETQIPGTSKRMTVLDPKDPHVPYDPNDPTGLLPDTNPNSVIIHPRRFFRTSEEWTSEINPDGQGVPYYGFQRMFGLNRPLNTLAGRQQFYIDHDWYLNEAEELPCYKPPVDSDNYPLRWITPHGRWSIHSTWRDAKYQLRMQRGKPIVYINQNEATRRGLTDNDRIKVYNDHGSFITHLCISNRMPDGMAQMYHGWEKYLFSGTGNWQSPTTIRIKPTQLVGRYGQLMFRLNYWGPTGNQKDTRVQIEKA